MTIINAKVDDNLVKEFRHVIYEKYGLKKGDFKNALEEAMLDYIRKHAAEEDIEPQLRRRRWCDERARRGGGAECKHAPAREAERRQGLSHSVDCSQ